MQDAGCAGWCETGGLQGELLVAGCEGGGGRSARAADVCLSLMCAQARCVVRHGLRPLSGEGVLPCPEESGPWGVLRRGRRCLFALALC